MITKSNKCFRIIIPGIAALIIVIAISACGKSKNINADAQNAKGQKKTVTNVEDEKKLQSERASNDKQTSKNNGQANTAAQSNNSDKNKNSKITIVIDPGHGDKANLQTEPIAPGSSEMKIKDGGGATGVYTGIPEYKVNLSVSLRLKTILEKEGYNVLMTKTKASENLGNVERAEVGNNAGAKLVIRIHADSCRDSSVKGASMLVPAQNSEYTKNIYTESERCGRIILDTLIKEVGMNNRGVVERNDLTGFNWSKVPVVLVEMGFLSDPDEDKLLASDSYEQRLAQGLADGISLAVK